MTLTMTEMHLLPAKSEESRQQMRHLPVATRHKEVAALRVLAGQGTLMIV